MYLFLWTVYNDQVASLFDTVHPTPAPALLLSGEEVTLRGEELPTFQARTANSLCGRS